MDVHKEMETMQQFLSALEGGEIGAEGLYEVHQQIQGLRSQIPELPEAVEEHLERLGTLAAQMNRYMENHATEIVDQFHAVGEAIRAASKEKSYLREVLARLARETGKAKLDGKEASVQIKEYRSVRLPRTGTPERERLRTLVEASSHWTEVSQLSAAKLAAALDQGIFSSSEQAEIAPLLPREKSLRVTSRPTKT